LCAFVERWHTETNSFYLPVGDLTITLDDMLNLLHHLVIEQFYTYPSLDAAAVIDLLVDSLRIDWGLAVVETLGIMDIGALSKCWTQTASR